MNDKFSVWVRDHKDENLRWEKEWGFSTDSEYAGRKLDEILTYMKETRPAEPGRFEVAVMKGKGENRTVHDGPFWVVPPVVLEVIVGEHKFRFPDDEGEKNSDGEGMNPDTEGHDTVTDDFKEDPEMSKKRKPETVTINVPTTQAETTAIIRNMLTDDMVVFLTDADPLPVPDVNNAEVPLSDPEAIREAIDNGEPGDLIAINIPAETPEDAARILNEILEGRDVDVTEGDVVYDVPPADGDLTIDPEAVRQVQAEAEETRRLLVDVPDTDADLQAEGDLQEQAHREMEALGDDSTAGGSAEGDADADADAGESGDASGDPQAQDGDTNPPATGDGETRTRRRNPDNKTGRIREARRVLDLAEGHLKAGRLDEVLPLIDQGAEITPPGVAKAEVQLVARAVRLRRLLRDAQELAAKAAETPAVANG